MTQDEGLLVAVEMWHDQHWAELAGEGISMTLRPRTTDLPKNSVVIDFETPSLLAQAIFWDSGESEVALGVIHSQEDPRYSTHHVVSVAEVEALLDRLHFELTGPAG
jgi:hypothetical protein